MRGPIEPEWHARPADTAYIILLLGAENTVFLAQKLSAAADVINREFSFSEGDKTSVRGLYEATNSVNGCHKFRYHVTKINLADAHLCFERVRQEYSVKNAYWVRN